MADENTTTEQAPEDTQEDLGTNPEDLGLETTDQGTPAPNTDPVTEEPIPGSGVQGDVPAELQEAADEAVEKGYLGANAADLTGRDKDLTQANPRVMNQEG